MSNFLAPSKAHGDVTRLPRRVRARADENKAVTRFMIFFIFFTADHLLYDITQRTEQLQKAVLIIRRDSHEKKVSGE